MPPVKQVNGKKAVNVPKPPSSTPPSGPALPRKVIYPKIAVNGIEVPPTILTKEQAKKILGWETEEEYSKRIGIKTEFGDDYLLKDMSGKKIRCWHNNNNRPFSETWARELAQSLLSREWADSRNGIDMTVNGETIIITRTGEVDSGQHRLIALVLACEEWLKQKAHWIEKWPEEPTMEAMVVTGISDNTKVTQTLDNVKPRSLSDVFYTSTLFRDLISTERKECSRMLQYAVDLLWERTRAADGFVKYQSHSASIDFVERHMKILECIKFIFENNKDRVLSNLKLSAGGSAGLQYLMGASASDGDEYHVGQPPSEKLISWEHWEDACQFFKLIVNTKDETMKPLREAIASLIDADGGLGGRVSEKHALICKAWLHYLNDDENLVDTPPLEYHKNEDGVVSLIDRPSVGGIDIGPKLLAEPKTQTPSEVAAEVAKVKSERVKQMDKTAKTAPTPTPAQQQLQRSEEYLKRLDDLNKLKAAHPNKVLLFKTPEGSYNSWASDATAIALLTGGKTVRHTSGMICFAFPAERYSEIVRLLNAGKRQIAVVKVEDGIEKVVDIQVGEKKTPPPSSPPAGTPKRLPSSLRGGTGS